MNLLLESYKFGEIFWIRQLCKLGKYLQVSIYGDNNCCIGNAISDFFEEDLNYAELYRYVELYRGVVC